MSDTQEGTKEVTSWFVIPPSTPIVQGHMFLYTLVTAAADVEFLHQTKGKNHQSSLSGMLMTWKWRKENAANAGE